jgi:hypothetical protein
LTTLMMYLMFMCPFRSKKRYWQDSNLRGKTQWISSPSP